MSTDPWSLSEWADKWGKAFGECISEEVQGTEIPLHQWRVSGRRTVANPNKEDMGWWSLAGMQIAKSYADWRIANPQYQLWVTPDTKRGNELEFIVNFGRVPVKVIIDRVFTLGDELIVVDLKSGNGMPEDVLQLAVYAAAVDLKYGVRPNLGAYFNNRKGGLVATEDLTDLPTDLVVSLFEDFSRQTELERYLPNPGRQCTWCEVAKNCKWATAVSTPIKGRQ